jgi:hypothetical protein
VCWRVANPRRRGGTKAPIPFEVLLREKSLSLTTAIRRSDSRSAAIPQDLLASKRWGGSALARQEGKSEAEKGGRKPAGSRFFPPADSGEQAISFSCEGESRANRAAEATGQVSLATNFIGAVPKDGSLLQFWLQSVARRILHYVGYSLI